MRSLALLLLLAGGAGVLATLALAIAGDTSRATQAAGAACSALVLGMILFRR